MDAGEKLVFVLHMNFSYDFCIAKNSSLLSIPKLNVVAVKENREEKTCGSHSFLRMLFLLVEAIWNSRRHRSKHSTK